MQGYLGHGLYSEGEGEDQGEKHIFREGLDMQLEELLLFQQLTSHDKNSVIMQQGGQEGWTLDLYVGKIRGKKVETAHYMCR